MELTPTPHIGAERGEIAESILLPGDPLRARMIAEKFFTDPVQFNSTRNMLGFTGTWNGKRISVMGTGMGCPSMGIYSHELIHAYGVRELIRVGTAGAMNEKVKVRDLVLAMGACSNTGYTKLFGLPGEFSCISSFRLLRKAAEAAEKHGLSFHVGNVLTSDMFYSPVKKEKTVPDFADMGVLAAEMETAALYANAALAGADALTICTVSDSMVTGETTTAEERETSFLDMVQVALETLF